MNTRRDLLVLFGPPKRWRESGEWEGAQSSNMHNSLAGFRSPSNKVLNG